MKKMKKQGGFTLVEMLIVVAIIAILIAISIPLVNNALEKARDATDDANYRDALGLGNIILLTETDPDGEYYYCVDSSDGVSGKLFNTTESSNGFKLYESQCASGSDSSTHGKTGTYANAHIKVTITKADDVPVVAEWIKKSDAPTMNTTP